MVNYPNRPKSQQKPLVSRVKGPTDFANRGMSFESAINASNEFYLTHNIAVIHKKPTPVQIVKVDYPKRSRAKIVEAYFRQASTTDYSGVYKGHYIDFEAKETRQKTAMPMKNFHSHQIEHMSQVLKQGGICFALLHFSSLNETYLLPASYLISHYQTVQGNKSLSVSYIREFGYEIQMAAFPSVPYLDVIDKKILGGDSYVD